jgi:hypothetical protein
MTKGTCLSLTVTVFMIMGTNACGFSEDGAETLAQYITLHAFRRDSMQPQTEGADKPAMSYVRLLTSHILDHS